MSPASPLPSPSLEALPRALLIVGCLSLLVATQLSAIGAHALREVLTPDQQQSWRWATDLQFYHSLGLILIALLTTRLGSPALLRWAGSLMTLGLFLFSGTIYLSLLGVAPVGQFAPLGGGSFMLAWLLVAIAAFRAPGAAA